MRTVFFDINIILDIFLKREPFYAASAQVFSLAETKQCDGCFGALSYPILFYLLKKDYPAASPLPILTPDEFITLSTTESAEANSP